MKIAYTCHNVTAVSQQVNRRRLPPPNMHVLGVLLIG